MRDGVLSLAALVSSIIGCGWLALAMDVHWRQAVGSKPLIQRSALVLRVAGAAALALSFWLCLQVDHVSMASLVWIMSLAAAALAVAFTLTWRAHWLAILVGQFRGPESKSPPTL